jgi:hypothetical protein
MQISYGKNPDIEYYMKTDLYPYIEAKEIVKSLEHWWDHPKRNVKEANREKISNYSLDTDLPNSLGYSFEHKLQNGSFSFLYNKDNEVMIYGGLLVDGKDSYLHRLTANPELFQNNFGLAGATIIPHHIKQAYDMGLDTYNITFNDHRYFIYRWWRDKLWEKGSTYGFKYPETGALLSKFEFKGKQNVFYTEQYICTLDLKRPDIQDFFTF